MANCKYCGKPAGLLRKKHADCEKQHKEQLHSIEKASSKIIAEALTAIKGTENFEVLIEKFSEIERSHSIPTQNKRPLLIKSWEQAVDDFLDDGVLDENEESRLVEFKNHFSLSQEDLDRNGVLTKTTKAAVLRDILNGVIPQKMTFDRNLPINLQKGEQVVWAFPNSQYLEDKTRRQYVGGSQGLSIRVMKGVYYRAGAFKGRSIEYNERVHVDTGLVILTNKNIYFAGSQKSLRLPYNKIVTFEPFSDGIGIMRDTMTAKPQIFVTNDGWFTYNLVSNLSQF